MVYMTSMRDGDMRDCCGVLLGAWPIVRRVMCRYGHYCIEFLCSVSLIHSHHTSTNSSSARYKKHSPRTPSEKYQVNLAGRVQPLLPRDRLIA